MCSVSSDYAAPTRGTILATHMPLVAGGEPQTLRVRVADHKVEAITSLKDLNRAAGTIFNTRIGVSP